MDGFGDTQEFKYAVRTKSSLHPRNFLILNIPKKINQSCKVLLELSKKQKVSQESATTWYIVYNVFL